MQLHVRVMGFDDEGFALQLALIYSTSLFYMENTPRSWIIGDEELGLEMVNMASEGYSDEMWGYYRLEFNEGLSDIGAELLRQMLLAEVPDAEFFDPDAAFEVRSGPHPADALMERLEVAV